MWVGAAGPAGPLTLRAPGTSQPMSLQECIAAARAPSPVSALPACVPAPPLADTGAEAPSHPGVRPWGQGHSSPEPTPCPGPSVTQGHPDSSTDSCLGGSGEYLSKKQFLGEVCYNY